MLRPSGGNGLARGGRGRRGIDYDLPAVDLAQRKQSNCLWDRDRLARTQRIASTLGPRATLPGGLGSGEKVHALAEGRCWTLRRERRSTDTELHRCFLVAPLLIRDQSTETTMQLSQAISGETRVAHRLKSWAGRIRRDAYALYLAGRDSRVPWYAKLLALFIAGYALSPIDLIPDFVPVLGYLDDLIIVPLGIWLVVRMIPRDVLAELRVTAEAAATRHRSRAAAGVIIAIWIFGAAIACYFVFRYH